MNLPEQYKEKLQKLLDDEFSLYESSLGDKPYQGLRVNTNKISIEEWERINPFTLEKVPWTENGYYYGEADCPAKHPYYYAGLYYLQEPSAMAPAACLPIQEGDKVLDICAAPGGKSTQLGAALHGSGILVSNDISSSRAKALLKNIEIFGIQNAVITTEEPGKLAEEYYQYFDKILVDAPCSGEGMFRRDPSMIKSWLQRGPEEYSPIQERVLLQSAEMLKPGGMILYSTCTFDPVENEEVIQKLLSHNKDFEVIQFSRKKDFASGFDVGQNKELEKCARLWPHRIKGEGHFLALLRRKSAAYGHDGESSGREEAIGREQTSDRELTADRKHLGGQDKKKTVCPESAADFLKGIKIHIDYSNIMIQKGKTDKLYLLPEGFSIKKGMRYLRTGLYLGEVKNGRFQPSQALAVSLGKEQYPNIIDFQADDERVIRYLKGETVYVDGTDEGAKKGWVLVCCGGYSLGWAKLVNGMLKNKYAVGWRWQ